LSRPGLTMLVGLIKSEQPELVVVGMPLTLRGERGEQARATEDFVARLAAEIDVPVETYDERFTTGLAQRTPSDAPEDARAAAHLLSSYLEWSSAAQA
jgi:putative pre-16S rRNA nuclease